MCEFISWIEKDKKAVFLTNEDLRSKKFEEYKRYNSNWKEDIKGHGAIEYFYNNVEGILKECTNFSTPKNFPKEIVKTIKAGELSLLGICVDVLNDKGKKLYEKIEQSALAEYKKIEQSALAEYEKIQLPAYAEYKKIEQPAWAEYKKIQQPVYAEYKKIQLPAYAEYEKIEQSAWAEYEKIEQPAWAEYEKIRSNAFHKIVIQKKYRNKEWK